MIGLGNSTRKALTTPVSGEDILATAAAMNSPAVRPHEPSIRERAGNAVYDALGALGLRGTAHQARQNLMPLMDLTPILGDAIGVEEAVQDYQAGDYGSALAGLGLTAVGVVPGIGDAAAAAGKEGLRAIKHRLGSEVPAQASMSNDDTLAFIKSYGLDAAEALGIISSETANALREQGFADR